VYIEKVLDIDIGDFSIDEHVKATRDVEPTRSKESVFSLNNGSRLKANIVIPPHQHVTISRLTRGYSLVNGDCSFLHAVCYVCIHNPG